MTRTEYDVTEYGATPNDGKPDTAAIQSAIDACAAAGSGVMRIPAGTFLSGALVIRDNVTLRLEEGAILKGSDNYLDYGKGQMNRRKFLKTAASFAASASFALPTFSESREKANTLGSTSEENAMTKLKENFILADSWSHKWLCETCPGRPWTDTWSDVGRLARG